MSDDKQLATVEGLRFGRIVVIGDAPKHITPSGQHVRRVFAKCECGTERVFRLVHLKSGHTESCGCLNRERRSARRVENRVGDHPLWRIYQGIRTRCENPNSAHYSRYGGRGIAVCLRWKETFWNFVADMGERPSLKHSIDRIDNALGYTPENCRWATMKQQARNRRNTRILSLNGARQCLKDTAASLGISRYVLARRLKKQQAI